MKNRKNASLLLALMLGLFLLTGFFTNESQAESNELQKKWLTNDPHLGYGCWYPGGNCLPVVIITPGDDES